jgi:CBS domain containing-hemolysin-like protein
VCRITGLAPDLFEDARGNADTLAGLVLELKGDIPKTGAELAWNNFVFTVMLADNRRIKQIKLSLPR